MCGAKEGVQCSKHNESQRGECLERWPCQGEYGKGLSDRENCREGNGRERSKHGGTVLTKLEQRKEGGEKEYGRDLLLGMLGLWFYFAYE